VSAVSVATNNCLPHMDVCGAYVLSLVASNGYLSCMDDCGIYVLSHNYCNQYLCILNGYFPSINVMYILAEACLFCINVHV